MRLAGIEKMGYYKTPPIVVHLTTTWLQASEKRSRLLDSCAGEGEAAAQVGAAINAETWGVELSDTRATVAMSVMDKVYNTGWQSVSVTLESVSLLWLNPPYDDDNTTGKRLERTFLVEAAPALVPGGILIYIIPQTRIDGHIARYLRQHFDDLLCFRFPDDEYEAFKQVVIFGKKRAQARHASAEEVDVIKAWAEAELPALTHRPETAAPYVVPSAPTKGKDGREIRFKRLDWMPADLAIGAMAEGVHTSVEWRDLVSVEGGNRPLTPAMPLKKGHTAMLMAAGLLGMIRLNQPDGSPMLIKGRVTKVEDVREESADGDGKLTKVTRTERLITTIVTVSGDGHIETIQSIEALTAFMRTYGDVLADKVLEAYTPAYKFDPTPLEWQRVSALGLNKRLPGRVEGGLLPAQKHVAIAAARAIRQHKYSIICAQMGFGKSITACAVVEALNAYPALIVCPPHLVPKWVREIEDAVPDAKALEASTIADVDKFVSDWQSGRLPHRSVLVMSRERIKLGSGWEAATCVKQRVVGRKKKGKPIIAAVHCCPECGQPIRYDDGTLVEANADGQEWLEKKRRFCSAKMEGLRPDDGDPRLPGHPTRRHRGRWGERLCRAPLFAYDKMRRVPMADYVRVKYSGVFRLLIADEVHQYKAKSSDQGTAFHKLVRACPATLALTGSLFGGKSTSVFWLLHRLNQQVRREFAFNAESRWSAHYGVLQRVSYKGRRSDDDEDVEEGVYSGNRRYREMVKELPGVSPAIIALLLEAVVFAKIKDLGYDMPAYSEEVSHVRMSKEQAEQYRRWVDGDSAWLRRKMKDAVRQGDHSLVSVWLQTALSRPNSAFRDEQVMTKGEPILELPAVIGADEVLPKEQWLASFCRAERTAGRKVLVYIRQTGTRDIQPRLREVLQRSGLRTVVLPGSVDARRREQWIAERVNGLDVLLTNPKLVETGLDLIQFSTIVFFEIEYSLPVMWQAMCRVWRPGQTRPVKCAFTMYQNTLESSALSYMGKKMYAAQLVYGDEVAGAIVEADDGDFLMELANEVLSGKQMDDLTTLFAQENGATNSITGSPTAVSPTLPTPVARSLEELRRLVRPAVRAVRRQVVNSQEQMALL